MNLLENETKDYINSRNEAIKWRNFLAIICVISLGVLIYKCNEFHNYKKVAESKMLRDSASVESYKMMLK
jgi:hypothetical protein